MSTATQPVLFRKKRLKAFRGRGQLYSWLRAHSERIAVGLSSGELTWPMICSECSRHGVASRDGLAPSQRAAAKAWQTLCRDLEAIGENPAERHQAPKPPSRFPKDWKPEAFRNTGSGLPDAGGAPSPSPPSPLVAARPIGAAPPSRFAKPDDPPEVKQMFADLEEDMRRQDRWMLKE